MPDINFFFAETEMNRRNFLQLATTAGMAGALCPMNSLMAFGREHVVRRTHGWTIDRQFGNAERRLLETALSKFYERFLQPYRPIGNGGRILTWEAGAYSVTGTHVGHYREDVNARSIFDSDWIAMWRHFANDQRPFPPVTLRFISEANAGFVAQARLDTILIRDWPDDDPYRGSFDIEINDWYLANRDYPYGLDTDYWAGTIAHEAWHNLGHRHPSPNEGGRNHPQYYTHQMVLHEMCVAQNSNHRFGATTAHPVYCRRHPG